MANTKNKAASGEHEYKLWGSRPYIALDGEDGNGVRAEVRINTGFGMIDPNQKTKNDNSGLAQKENGGWRVSFYKNSEYTDGGYVNSPELIEMLRKAEAEALPIYYRIECQRTRGVPRETPFEELLQNAKANYIKRVVALRFNQEDDWTLDEKTALTNPEEDALDYSSQRFSALTNPPQKKDSQPKVFASSHSPYVSSISGHLNPESVAYGVPSTIYFFLLERAKEQGVETTSKRLRMVAEKVLNVCNRLQQDITGSKEIELSTSSHTRARSFVMSTITHVCPVDDRVENGSDEQLQEWLKEVYKSAGELNKWSRLVASNAMGLE